MKIGVIQASSQAEKNSLIEAAVRKYAVGHTVYNFGCGAEEAQLYSYIEISVLIGMLLSSGAIDFIVTGCSSGQGMMLSCNSMPGVICGYAPTPRDAYLFAQINNGNAISLPLGEKYTYAGPENLERTIEQLFIEPFGQGWPKQDAARKLADTKLLHRIRRDSQVDIVTLLNRMEPDMIRKSGCKRDVIEHIRNHGTNAVLCDWIDARFGLH